MVGDDHADVQPYESLPSEGSGCVMILTQDSCIETVAEFVDMLNEMRFGRLSEQSIKKFYSLSRPIEYEDGLGPTELYAGPSAYQTLDG